MSRRAKTRPCKAKAFAVAGLPARQFSAAVAAVSGERLGVDGVGFADCAERADEGLDLAGVGAMDGNAGGEQGGKQGALVAAGGLADDETRRLEARGEVRQGLGLVGDRARAAGHGIEDDDRGFADVATDEARNRRGGMGHFRLSFASL
jgi:hypothetical protein